MMTDEQVRAKGWSIPVYRAIEAAGGPVAVAYAFKMKSVQGVQNWYLRRAIPAPKISKLCELAGGKVTAQQILDDLEESRVAA